MGSPQLELSRQFPVNKKSTVTIGTAGQPLSHKLTELAFVELAGWFDI